MPTIDLSNPPPPPAGLLEGLPRRSVLTLPELQFVAERAGGAPLPFDVHTPAQGGPSPTPRRGALRSRLGAVPEDQEDAAYLAALGRLRQPEVSLRRRGLMRDGVVDDGLLGAVGLLATPRVALDLDLVVDGVQAKAWHRQSGEAVATLATCDGVAFELAWFPIGSWRDELARVGVLPEDRALRESAVPRRIDLPFELADAALEAAETGRADLVAILLEQHAATVVGADGQPLEDAEAAGVLSAVGLEAQGRLRVLAGAVSGDRFHLAGVRSWVLLADGWRSVRPHEHDTGETGGAGGRVELVAVRAEDLGADLAPVLAEVLGHRTSPAGGAR